MFRLCKQGASSGAVWVETAVGDLSKEYFIESKLHESNQLLERIESGIKTSINSEALRQFFGKSTRKVSCRSQDELIAFIAQFKGSQDILSPVLLVDYQLNFDWIDERRFKSKYPGVAFEYKKESPSGTYQFTIAGVDVQLYPRIGSRAFAFSRDSLRRIDLVPDSSGRILKLSFEEGENPLDSAMTIGFWANFVISDVPIFEIELKYIR